MLQLKLSLQPFFINNIMAGPKQHSQDDQCIGSISPICAVPRLADVNNDGGFLFAPDTIVVRTPYFKSISPRRYIGIVSLFAGTGLLPVFVIVFELISIFVFGRLRKIKSCKFKAEIILIIVKLNFLGIDDILGQ